MDIKTLVISLFVINLFLGIFTYVINISQRNFKNVRFWIIGNLLIAFGYLFLVLRNIIPDFLSIVVAQFLFLLAGILRIHGFKKLFNINVQIISIIMEE